MELIAGKVAVKGEEGDYALSDRYTISEEHFEKLVREAQKVKPLPTPPKLYKIGEVVEFSGFSRQTIHNYTAMGLINESKWTVAGHRLYDEDVFHRLAIIKHLRGRYPLAVIKKVLEKVFG